MVVMVVIHVCISHLTMCQSAHDDIMPVGCNSQSERSLWAGVCTVGS